MSNRNPYTNPNAISNSGSSYFTNQKSKILKLNLNLIANANMLNDFLVEEYNKNIKTTSTTTSIPTQNTTDDFLTILQNQKNNSKLNKLSYT